MKSRRRLVGVLGVAIALASGAMAGSARVQGPPSPSPAPPAPPPPSQTPPVFRGGVNYVLVDAYPQRQGQIVEGLTAADFQILEDGKPQAIDTVEFVRVDTRQPDSAYRDPNTVGEMNEAAADPHARVFVVFLDTLHTKVDGSQRIRVPLVKTLNSVIGPADLFGVTTQNQRARDLTLGRRMTSVEDQLSKYWSWGRSDRKSYDPEDPTEDMLTSCFHILRPKDTRQPAKVWMVNDGSAQRVFDELLIDRRREDRTLTSVSDLVGYLGTLREARSVLVVITDGWQLFSVDLALQNEPSRDQRFDQLASEIPMPGYAPAQSRGGAVAVGEDFSACMGELTRLTSLDDERRFRDIIALAQRSNVSIYPVSSAGLEVFEADLSQREVQNPDMIPGSATLQGMSRMNDRVRTLRTLAENTDGIAIVQTNDLAAGMKRIVDDVSAYYLLGYYTTNAKADGKFRKIEVKMKTPGLTVHARRGYLAPLANARATKAGAAETSAAVTVTGPSAVDGALAALSRAGGSTELFTYASAAGGDLAIVVELGNRPSESGDWAKGAAVTADVTSASGARVATGTVRIEAGMRGAVVHVPIGADAGPWKVSTRVTGGPSALTDRLDVSPGRGLLLGDPMVFRATPSPRSPLLPVADFEFRRSERVHIEWPVLKPLDQRTVRVLDRRGQPLALGSTLTEREVDGKTSVAVDVNLAPLAEGDYVVEVSAGSGAEAEKKFVAMRVIR